MRERAMLTDSQEGSDPRRGDPDAAYRRLRREFIEGRLTLPDFEEQVGRVYATSAVREPAIQVAEIPTRSITRPRRSQHEQVVPYASVMVLLVGIWALTGMEYFWPIWPMMGWGIPVLLGVLGMRNGCGTHAASRRHHAHLLDGHHQNPS
ncbi:MAG: 2TM domain-containing protein [Chloroflexota bacterium]|nr:2TM domain-containing protein [Chloroflexota bacterium]